jgi:predicted Fe-Mo cluster-binding NifX family protein
MRIGVTSQNFKTVTGHAGKARRFLVFENNANGELEIIQRLDLPKEMSIHEFKGESHPLDELDVLITGGCGNGFIQRMATKGVTVIATSETSIPVAVESVFNGIKLPAAVEHTHSPS